METLAMSREMSVMVVLGCWVLACLFLLRLKARFVLPGLLRKAADPPPACRSIPGAAAYTRADFERDLRAYIGGDLGCGGRVRGVQKGAVGTAKNIEAYTPKQLSQTLNHLKMSRLEETILAELRKQ